MPSQLQSRILAAADPSQVAGLSRFFKTGPGQYGEGDKFLGIKVPLTREIVKECWRETALDELEECISSEYHELRLAALLTLVQIYKHAKADSKEACIRFYLSHTAYINNWDLVDLSCYELLGNWLLDKDRQLLYNLALNGSTIWERRIGIVSTMAFLRKGQLDDTYSIVDIFLAHPSSQHPSSSHPSSQHPSGLHGNSAILRPDKLHDLLQKACGWLLREAGKRDEARLVAYLRANKAMPRTMLRYAIEKLEPSLKTELMA